MRNNNSFTASLLFFGMLGLIPNVSSASSLPSALVISHPGLVTISDGVDQGALVNLQISARWLCKTGYEFGYLDGGIFSSIGDGSSGTRNQTFHAGAVVDFALRNNGADGIFGTPDDSLFKISDAASHVTQSYSNPLSGLKSGDTALFSQLMLGWDTNQDGTNELTVMLKSCKCTVGMFYTATATPVPVPAALWLFGSGLAGLFAFVRRRKQS